MNNIETAAQKLNGNVWIKGDMVRVYLPTEFKKGQKAYLEFDEILEEGDYDNFMHGASLKVFTQVKKQGMKWNINQSKILKFGLMKKISELTGLECCRHWEHVTL